MLGEKLLKMGLITQAQLDACLAEQAQTGKRLGEILVAKGHVTQKQVDDVLAST